MACGGFFGCLLKLLNFLMTLVGLAMVGYGIYLLIEFLKSSSDTLQDSPVSSDQDFILLGRPLLMSVSLSSSISDKLQEAWFIYLFIGIGIVLFIIAKFGCAGVMTRNRCCLGCYSVFVILVMAVELACAGFIYFDKDWKDKIPTDDSGDFDMIVEFFKKKWKIVRWVALAIIILEAILFLLTLVVKATNKPAEYDSDEEFINPRQPLINRPIGPVTGLPVTGALDQRPSRSDAWSTRMREKYGLDTSEFTYNPSESNRYQQVQEQPNEERKRCTIM